MSKQTYYAIFNKDGVQVSDACKAQDDAWISAIVEGAVVPFLAFARLKNLLEKKGYTCKPVLCVNPETHNAVEKVADAALMACDALDKIMRLLARKKLG